MNDRYFRKKLEVLINHHSCENGSNTPDFILAKYLTDCLHAFDKATEVRERWYGRKRDPYQTDFPTSVDEGSSKQIKTIKQRKLRKL